MTSLSTVGDRWVSCQLDAKTIRTNEVFKNRTISFGKRDGWGEVEREIFLPWSYPGFDIKQNILQHCPRWQWSDKLERFQKGWLQTASIPTWHVSHYYVLWPLITSRVAFSSVTWKRFCLGDLSVSWCLWSMIVMGNYSTFIKTTPPLKWNEFFILKLFRTWECVLCKNVLFAHGGAPLPYSQQTKVVSTSNLSRCPHTRVHRAGLWHSNTSTTLWRQTFHFFCGATQKPWIWRNGSFGTIFIFCDRVSTDKMESVWRFFCGLFF